MQVIVNSLLINYQQSGQGPALVMLHGWADNLRTFSSLQKDLASDYQLISVDLPGFGGSQAPLTTWDLDDYANFVADFLTKLSIEPVHAIVGHSNGGAVAIRGLASGKLSADKLVLLASSGIRPGFSAKKALYKTVAKIGGAASLALPAPTRRKLRARLYKAAKSDMLAAEHMQEAFKKIVAQDVQPDAKQLNLPTLLIYGQGDTETPALFGVRFNKLIKNSELVILDAAGHFVHQDQPEAVVRAIKRFLK